MTRPSTPVAGGQPKTMSSRLLTMKFMQRAAASSSRSTSNSNTPIRGTTDPPSAKRQKLTDSETSMPGTPNITTPQTTDLRMASATLAAEERTKFEARLRSAAAGGETEWILSLPGANAFPYANLQANGSCADRLIEDEKVGEDEIWRDHTVGRRSYGNFRRKKIQVGSTPSNEPSEDPQESSETDASYLELGVSQIAKPRPRSQNRDYEDGEEKRWQAMDRMNLKKQDHISGFSPKRAHDDRMSKVKKKPRHSFNS